MKTKRRLGLTMDVVAVLAVTAVGFSFLSWPDSMLLGFRMAAAEAEVQPANAALKNAVICQWRISKKAVAC